MSKQFMNGCERTLVVDRDGIVRIFKIKEMIPVPAPATAPATATAAAPVPEDSNPSRKRPAGAPVMSTTACPGTILATFLRKRSIGGLVLVHDLQTASTLMSRGIPASQIKHCDGATMLSAYLQHTERLSVKYDCVALSLPLGCDAVEDLFNEIVSRLRINMTGPVYLFTTFPCADYYPTELQSLLVCAIKKGISIDVVHVFQHTNAHTRSCVLAATIAPAAIDRVMAEFSGQDVSALG